MERIKIDRKELERKIFSSLKLQEVEEQPGLGRAQREINAEETERELSGLQDHSQRKRKRIADLLSAGLQKGSAYDVAEELKELEWRLDVLRNDRKQRQKKPPNQQMSFDELYTRQKEKYAKFRERSKMKVSDPQYLDMLGAMLMRREKRKLTGMEKIDKHIESLDLNIKHHSLDQHRGRGSRKH